MNHLREAARRGYSDVEQFKSINEFGLLRARPDLEALMRELESRQEKPPIGPKGR
jgi:hypothetical protein